MEAILKKSSWLFAAQIIARAISFFYAIFLARSLGISDFGLYSAALAYFSLAAIIADFGFNRFLIREIALDKSKSSEILINVSILRLTFAAVLFALFAIVLTFLDPDSFRVNLILLATLAVLPHCLSQGIDGIFVAFEKLYLSAISLLVLSVATTILGVTLVSNQFGPTGAAVALILGQFIYLLFLAFLLVKQKVPLNLTVNKYVLKEVIIGSLPYGLLGIMSIIYFKVDTILLTYLKGNFETGIYSAGYKFLESIVFIPSVISTAIFPSMAKLHDNQKELKNLYFKSLKLMALFATIVVISYLIILPEIIKIFLPNYLLSIGVIQILSLTIPFMFLHAPAVQVLLSGEKHLKMVLQLSLITLLFNLLSNLLFIPKYGFLAAAWITVLSEILSFIIFFIVLQRRVFK